jgi:beta-lactamase regulating signal transducer with metallopeptidase domain
MEHLIQHGLSNAAAAAVLAILAAIATRLWRNPHFAYALWLVVLVRLVAPPLVAVPLPIPAWTIFPEKDSSKVSSWIAGTATAEISHEQVPPMSGSEEQRVPQAVRAGSGATPTQSPGAVQEFKSPRAGGFSLPDVRRAGLIARPEVPESGGSRDRSASIVKASATRSRESTTVSRQSVVDALAIVWLTGTFGYLLLVAVRAGRFSRALRSARREVPEFLHAEAAALAGTVGLRRPPRLALIEAPLPPLVWPGWRPTVLLPQPLIDSLSVSQRRLLLLHEFEHIRRRDHRVRWFRIGVVALYWWNPIAWWAARRLELAEEECCDAAVLCLHPDQSEGYGQTLLAVSEFLSIGKFPAPALSISMARKNHLKRRLTMILNGPRWPRLSKTRLAVFGILGAALIAVTWTVATAQNAPAPPVNSVPTPSTRQPETPIPKLVKAPATAAQGLAGLLKFEPLKLDPRDDAKLPLVQKLLKERYNAALRAARLCEFQYEAGTTTMSALCAATRHFVDAQLTLVEQPSEKIRIGEWYVEFSNQAWRMADARLKANGVTGFIPIDEAEARAARFEAEIKLLELRRAASQNETRTTPVAASPVSTPAQPAEGLAALLQFEILKPTPGDDEQRKLLKERHNAALRALNVSAHRYEAEMTTAKSLCNATRDFVDAKLALADSPLQRTHVATWYHSFALTIWKQANAKLNAGGQMRANQDDEAEARNAVAEAQSMASEASVLFPALLTSKPLDIAPQDDERQRLLKQRYNAALRSLKASYARREVDPTVPFVSVIAAARQLLPADVAMHKAEDIVRVHERYLDLMKFFEKRAEAQVGTTIGRDELEAAHEARLDAEIKLLDAKSGRSQTQSTNAAVLTAKAELEAAKATLDQRKAALARAKADLFFRKTQYDRIVRLYEQKAIEVRLVDELRNKRDAAAATVNEAEAAIRAAESNVSLKQAQLNRLTSVSEPTT